MAKSEKRRVYVDAEYMDLLRRFNPIYEAMSDTKLINHILAIEAQRMIDKSSQMIQSDLESDDDDDCDITDELD